MFARIGRFVTRRAWFIVGFWLAAAVAVITAAPPLSGITNSDQSAFLPASAESSRAAALAGHGPAGASAVVVVRRADRAPLADADLAAVSALAGRLDAAKPAAVAAVAYDPRAMVAPNRAVATIALAFTGPAERADVRAAVTSLRGVATSAVAGGPLVAGITGQAAIVVDNKAAFASAEMLVTVVTLGLIVVLLLLIFRSVIAALLPLVTVGLVFAVSSALVSIAGHVAGFKIGEELPTMMTVVLFGIGTDYILFLLFRYRERRRTGDSPTEAVVAAVERVGEAIFSAAFAVIAAFGALVLATLGFFTTLGPALAIGVAVMLLAALTLVPAVMSLLGSRLFRKAATTPVSTRNGRMFAGLGRLVARRPVAVIVVGVALLGGLGTVSLTFRADYDPIDQLPYHTESGDAFSDLQRGFPAGALAPTHVYLRGGDPAAVSAALANVPGVATVMPPAPLSPSVTDVAVLLAVSPYSEKGLDLVSGPVKAAAGPDALVGGQTMVLADVRATSAHDLRVILPVAGLLFLLILAGMVRAALAPVYLVAVVGGGFAATLGAVTLVFQNGFGHAGLQFALPIILYLFVTAIGTDYNILMTARLREELRDGRPPREAAALAVANAGPSVAAAALILAGTFAALLVSGVPFFAEIGFGVTIGIAIVSWIVSIMIVPAASALLGAAAWWPGRRPHHRDAIEGLDPDSAPNPAAVGGSVKHGVRTPPPGP